MAPICHHLTGNGINYGMYLLFTKVKTPRKISVCKGFGGEREIRTLGRVLAYTRFPVVRLRPAQPSLHICLYVLYAFCWFFASMLEYCNTGI